MTAAHCVYETTKHGNLLGIAPPSALFLRVGSRDVSNAALGVSVRVVAVLPQPYYRWDGTHHFHDIALLALERPLSQTPARLAEQRPGAGKSLLIAGYGRSSTRDRRGPRSCKVDRSRQPTRPPAISSRRRSTPPGSSAAARRPTTWSCPVGRPASVIQEALRSPPRTPRATSSSKASSATARESTANPRAPT